MVILGPGYGLVIGDRKFFLFSPEISRFNNGYYRTRFFKEEEKKKVNVTTRENSCREKENSIWTINMDFPKETVYLWKEERRKEA